MLGRLTVVLVVTGPVSVSCGNASHHDSDADRLTPPKPGTCRDLVSDDLERSTKVPCSDWVGAWMHDPPDHDDGYSWFHEVAWATGNRRSVCWARTAG